VTEPAQPLEAELAHAARVLSRLGRRFALVGGLAVSIRGEVRFTRDIDFAVECASDREAERVAADVAAAGYVIAAIVEDEATKRLSTVRLRSRARVAVDLLVASSGIEAEVIAHAQSVDIPGVGALPVARAEELLALKTLSMSENRPQDRLDARGLLLACPDLDLTLVHARLSTIEARGFHRDQDLHAKLDALVRAVRATGG
jgi:hypothetical protein